MKEIVLQRLSLVNFKGIRSLDLNFYPGQTFIYGENGTGKTTVFDAFLWCLFGKDSSNRSDSNFNIKTLGEDGKPILKLDHSVTCELLVSGTPVKLQRRYVEVWVKPRGTSEETMTNHKTEFFINDVKLSTKKEYDAEINGIIPEDVFKMITNPLYFTSLPADSQKQMLLEMAGEVTDAEVAAQEERFLWLLAQLQGKQLAVFLKEVAAKKRSIKDELTTIPASIETAQKLRPQPEDWDALEAELKDKKARVADIDAQLSDSSERSAAETKRKVDIQRTIGDKKMELQRRESQLRMDAEKSVTAAQQEIATLNNSLDSLKRERSYTSNSETDLRTWIDSLEQKIVAKRQDFYTENARQLTFPDGAFICPTCKRPLEPDDIEAKQHELEENFNREKSARLQTIKADGVSLKEQQNGLKNDLAEKEKALADYDARIESLEAEIEAKRASVPAAPDTNKILAEDSTCISLRNEITELSNQLTMEAKQEDTSELREAKRVLSENIEEIIKRKAKKEQIERAEKEIQELEEKRVAANQALADLEGAEFVATDFLKAKDATLLDRINGMFNLVSFSFIDTQLNGGEKITCVCTVDGTPYPDVNNAGKINAGIDIINALCKSKDICAPIFIDNRESVNDLLPTVSQVVNLCVSKDTELVASSEQK